LKAPEREWNRIEKILALIIYAACHLKLEMHLLRDSSCPRPPPLPEKPVVEPEKHHPGREASKATIHAPEPDPDPPLPPEDQLATSVPDAHQAMSPVESHSSEESTLVADSTPKEVGTKGHSKKWSRSNLVSLFFRDRQPSEPGNKLKKRIGGRLKMHRTRSMRRSEDRSQISPLSPREDVLPMPGAFAMEDWELVAPEKKVVAAMARTEEEQAGEILTAPGSPIESIPPELAGQADVVLSPDVFKPESNDPNPNERFKRVIERMTRTILSVSPDVHFPPPSLLLSLREQEQLQESPEPAMIPGRPLLSRVQSSSAAEIGISSPNLTDGLPLSVSVPSLATEASLIPRTPRAAQKISIDARAGLASLMTGNNSLVSKFR
jgi:hypothetical protein